MQLCIIIFAVYPVFSQVSGLFILTKAFPKPHHTILDIKVDTPYLLYLVDIFYKTLTRIFLLLSLGADYTLYFTKMQAINVKYCLLSVISNINIK